MAISGGGSPSSNACLTFAATSPAVPSCMFRIDRTSDALPAAAKTAANRRWIWPVLRTCQSIEPSYRRPRSQLQRPWVFDVV